MHTDIAAAVLAGGSSRRMGRDKALVAVDGSPMVARVADAIVGAGCRPVVVVGGDTEALTAIGLTVVADLWPGEGPLGAIITALQHIGGPTMVVACDLPWLDAATIGAVLADAQSVASAVAAGHVTVATTDRDQLLCACWQTSALAHLRRRFSAGERSVHAVLDGLIVRRVAVSAAALRNVNAPGDLPSV